MGEDLAADAPLELVGKTVGPGEDGQSGYWFHPASDVEENPRGVMVRVEHQQFGTVFAVDSVRPPDAEEYYEPTPRPAATLQLVVRGMQSDGQQEITVAEDVARAVLQSADLTRAFTSAGVIGDGPMLSPKPPGPTGSPL